MQASEIPPEALAQAVEVLAKAYADQGLSPDDAHDFAATTVRQAVEQGAIPGLELLPAPGSAPAGAWPFPVKPQPDGGQ
jgi:hypothetical protein